MEWVETTATTVGEAKELLLDQLGVDASDTEFEILEEPKAGLFGRTKGQARVRARVMPKTPPSPRRSSAPSGQVQGPHRRGTCGTQGRSTGPQAA